MRISLLLSRVGGEDGGEGGWRAGRRKASHAPTWSFSVVRFPTLGGGYVMADHSSPSPEYGGFCHVLRRSRLVAPWQDEYYVGTCCTYSLHIAVVHSPSVGFVQTIVIPTILFIIIQALEIRRPSVIVLSLSMTWRS